MQGRVSSIVNPEKKTGEKDGKRWRIMTVEVTKEDGEVVKADSFDSLELDMVVDVELKVTQQGDRTYRNWTAKRQNVAKRAAEGVDTVMLALRKLYEQGVRIEDKLDKLTEIRYNSSQEPLPSMPDDLSEFLGDGEQLPPTSEIPF